MQDMVVLLVQLLAALLLEASPARPAVGSLDATLAADAAAALMQVRVLQLLGVQEEVLCSRWTCGCLLPGLECLERLCWAHT